MKKTSVTIKPTTAHCATNRVDVPVGSKVEFVEGAGGGWALTTDQAKELGIDDFDLQHYYPYIDEKTAVAGYDYEVNLVRRGYMHPEWKQEVDAWRVIIGGIGYDFYTGTGLRTKDKRGYEHPVQPSYDSVIHSLLTDARAHDYSFSDWCAEYGYNDDSIKDKSIYDGCVETYHNLVKSGVDIDAEQKRLEDY